MQLRKTLRKAVKLRVGFSGPSGAGKTLSSLRVAGGMVKGDWDKVALIDTEKGSGELYGNNTFRDENGNTFTIGDFNYIRLDDYSPDAYIRAIEACEKAGVEVIIIDSMTHSWEYILDWKAQIDAEPRANQWTNWGIVKPAHKRLRNKILESPCHMFCGTRRKQDLEQTVNDQGRKVIQKMGTKEEMSGDWEYELTINFDIEITHKAKAIKDRSGMFVDTRPDYLSEKTGEQLLEWCGSGGANKESLLQAALVDVKNTSSKKALTDTFLRYADLKEMPDFVEACKAHREELTKLGIN